MPGGLRMSLHVNGGADRRFLFKGSCCTPLSWQTRSEDVVARAVVSSIMATLWRRLSVPVYGVLLQPPFVMAIDYEDD